MLGNMAATFEQPLFFSSAMITTSARLQHLDLHFSLHAKLSGYRQAASRSHVDRTHSSPIALQPAPVKSVKRLTSRSSISSDAASFHTAVWKAEDDQVRQEKTARKPEKAAAAIPLEDAQQKVARDDEANSEKDPDRAMPHVAGNPMMEPLRSLPMRHRTTSRKEGTRRALDHRRISTISEPLPGSFIPRRTSSTIHRRQRKGQDLISFHRDSCRFFQSLEGTLSANSEGPQPILSRHYSMPGSRFMSFSESLKPPVIENPTKHVEDPAEDQALLEREREIPEFVASTVSLPVSVEVEEMAAPTGPTATTVVSWTTAETRKREYEKIDQAHSGFRGLWRKLTPKWCHGRDARRKFFDGKCDGDSVRRYRLEMPIKSESGDRIPRHRRHSNFA